MISALPRVLFLLCLACLASASRADAQAAPAPIRDDAGMFRSSVINRATQEIAELRGTFDRGLFVRTIPTAAPQPSRWLPLLRTPRINRMLEEQLRTFADTSGERGIYVLICNRPRDVRVLIRPEGDRDLNRHDAETLRQTLLRDLHEKNADAALLALVGRVQDMLQEHAESGSSPVVNGIVLLGLLGGGVSLWLVLRLIRRRIRAGSEGDREILFRQKTALLGAMFGFPAGLWICDKMCPCSETSQVSDAS